MRDVFFAGGISVAVCLISGPLLIPLLRRLKFGQHIRSDGPQAHLRKAGTPTMGGIMFYPSILAGVALTAELNASLGAVLFASLGLGLIGFIDDFIKVVLRRSLGLKALQKIIGQFLIAAVFTYFAVVYLGRGTQVLIPGTSLSFDFGPFYYIFAILVMVGANNAVNLTDGLDGLAAGVTVFVVLTYLLLSKVWGLGSLVLFCAALLGSCLGFLFFNIHPARLFMGDTGSLLLGGAIGALAILTKTELLLLVVGGVYVVETLSVIIQVLYFKATGGKRFFRMSPLHHHFELLGWSETKVVLLFWTAAALCAVLSVIIML